MSIRKLERWEKQCIAVLLLLLLALVGIAGIASTVYFFYQLSLALG